MTLRIITSYALAGTRSFRLGSRKVFGRYGMNLQNPDKHTQDIAEAPPGYSIVQADQAGAEALAVAYLSSPGRYRKLFLNGVKPHTYLAMHLFAAQFGLSAEHPYLSMEIEELVRQPDWPELHKKIKSSGKPYDIGKRTAHGSSYRMGPRTFRNANLKQSKGTLRLSQKQCAEFLETFKRLFPEVVNWQDEIEMRVRSERRLVNLLGFERLFFRELTDSYVREAISWIPQSTIGCITHEGATRAYEAGLWVCSNKHDSYACMVPDKEVGEVAAFMQKSMAIELPGRDCTFTMRSEVQVGKNWKPYSESNPNGMKDYKV